MTKQEIISRLIENHEVFSRIIDKMDDMDFMFAPENKWTAGQQLEHIYLSVRPLNLIFGFPKLMIRAYFGKANRPSKDYETLVQKYKTKLAAGYKSNNSFLPKPVSLDRKKELLEKLHSTVAGLAKKTGRFSEQQLDRMIIPHPLLGKLTIREMMYFTIYHVEHHQALTLLYLEGKQ